jgi:hypothetical protein
MDTFIALAATPLIVLAGIIVSYRRPRSGREFGTLQVTRRKRAWNEGALAERAAERLRG